jgi:hypothetical protein
MDWINEPLQIGTWVKLDRRMLNNFTGFIVKFDHEEDKFRVQLTKNASGNQTEGSLWVDSYELIPLEDESQDFLQGLIDTTLFLKQKEWFMELTSKHPLEAE